LAIKPKNILIFPFFAKKHDTAPEKNAKIGQQINFPKSDGKG